MPIQFTCNCTKSRVEKALISIGGRELQEMIDEGKSIEVNCQFCNKHYEFSVDELKKLYEKLRSKRNEIIDMAAVRKKDIWICSAWQDRKKGHCSHMCEQ